MWANLRLESPSYGNAQFRAAASIAHWPALWAGQAGKLKDTMKESGVLTSVLMQKARGDRAGEASREGRTAWRGAAAGWRRRKARYERTPLGRAAQLGCGASEAGGLPHPAATASDLPRRGGPSGLPISHLPSPFFLLLAHFFALQIGVGLAILGYLYVCPHFAGDWKVVAVAAPPGGRSGGVNAQIRKIDTQKIEQTEHPRTVPFAWSGENCPRRPVNGYTNGVTPGMAMG